LLKKDGRRSVLMMLLLLVPLADGELVLLEGGDHAQPDKVLAAAVELAAS
jgi:hypothetical protein